jgi:hypothetical protein
MASTSRPIFCWSALVSFPSFVVKHVLYGPRGEGGRREEASAILSDFLLDGRGLRIGFSLPCGACR